MKANKVFKATPIRSKTVSIEEWVKEQGGLSKMMENYGKKTSDIVNSFKSKFMKANKDRGTKKY